MLRESGGRIEGGAEHYKSLYNYKDEKAADS